MTKFPVVRVLITEEDEWKKKWDPGGDIMNWASDSASDDWHGTDAAQCADYIGDLAKASLKKAEWARIGNEDLERVCEHLGEDRWSDELEATVYSVIDALQWAWEEAYTPDDGEIEEAMGKAGERWDPDFSSDWGLVMGEIRRPPGGKLGPKEWVPQIFRWDRGQVVDALVKQVSYSRKKGWYDRYLVFNFGEAKPVQDLLKEAERRKGALETKIRALDAELPGLPETQQGYDRRDAVEDQIQELQDEIDGLDGIPGRLKKELDDLVWDYMNDFFSALEDVMQESEPGNKFNLDPHWKAMLADGNRMKTVREEILEFLEKHPAEGAGMGHRLGIKAPKKSYSLCRMVHVQKNTRLLHTTLALAQDDLTKRVLVLSVLVMHGALRSIGKERCGSGPPSFNGLREEIERLMASMSEKMALHCVEEVSKKDAIELILAEVAAHKLGDVAELKRVVSEQFKDCFGD